MRNLLIVNPKFYAAAWAAIMKRPTIWDVIREMERREQEAWEKLGLGHA